MAHLDAACMAHLGAASAVTPPPHCPPGYAVPVNEEEGLLKTEECVLDLTYGALSHICNALHVFLLTTAGVGGGEGVSRCEEGGEGGGGKSSTVAPPLPAWEEEEGGEGGGGGVNRSRWPRKKNWRTVSLCGCTVVSVCVQEVAYTHDPRIVPLSFHFTDGRKVVTI
jgi:hypothetical protein